MAELSVEERFRLITRNAEEVLTEEDLIKLLESGEKIKHYIGFEISGKVHLGTGLMCMSKVKDFLDAGVEVNILLADWHSWINNKLDGNKETIRKIALGYFKEALIASFITVGGDPSKLNFILGTDLYHNNDKYWETVIDVSKHVTLSRIKRSITIMGRKEGDSINFATLIYPPMQVADIFIQGVNLTHAGMDQRKAHVIARDVALKLTSSPLFNSKGEKIKPVAIHHPLLLGLGKPPVWPVPDDKMQELWSSLKMSKSKPDTCIFIHDSPDEIRRKIRKAFCPEGEVNFNPILDWTKKLIFAQDNAFLKIERPAKYGGTVIYESYEDLERDFQDRKIHPLDLKNAVAEKLIKILEPARKYFEKPKLKNMLEELDRIVYSPN